MKKVLLSSVAATALVLGVVAASAQQSGSGQGRDQELLPKQGEQGGQQGTQQRREQTGQEKLPQQRDQTGQEGTQQRREQTGQEKLPQQRDQTGQEGTQQRREQTGQEGTQQRREQTGQEGTQQRREQTGKEGTGKKDEATGAVSLTQEQRTTIKQKVNVNRFTVKDVNCSVSVGVAVPRTITLYDPPPEIIEIVPAWRRYKIIVVGGDILLIDPDTYLIVAVIPV